MRILPIVVSLMSLGCGSDHIKVSTVDKPVLQDYLAARPFSCQNDLFKITIPLNGGISLNVHAYCFVGGRFTAQYSDEQSERLIGNPGDYVYPCDLRMDPSNRYLYGLARGIHPFDTKTRITTLFVYDLYNRKQISTLEIAPGVLPEVAQ